MKFNGEKTALQRKIMSFTALKKLNIVRKMNFESRPQRITILLYSIAMIKINSAAAKDTFSAIVLLLLLSCFSHI